ncbi:hypothetical protein EDD11_000218 [Mortierella claussenii]|nr:hypothetical protein EDD11_000218 [Mortierella claussenii]
MSRPAYSDNTIKPHSESIPHLSPSISAITTTSTSANRIRPPGGHDQEHNPDGTVRRRGAASLSEITTSEAAATTEEPELKDEKRQAATTIELSHIDHHDEHPKGVVGEKEIAGAGTGDPRDEHEEGNDHAVRTWTDRMHGHRRDRHLFPYRSVKENMRAARTFLRRFFFLFLIIPAWIIPNVLTAKAEHELELSHGGEGNTTTGVSHAALQYGGLKYVMLSEAGVEAGGAGAAAHGPELSKVANWFIFLLNMLVMMHLGKAAGVALEELVPKFGPRVVSIFDALTSSSVELAVAAFALSKGLVVVVQAAMLGAILNNLLLMMGIAILIGGIHNHQQTLKKETTQTSVNILMLTCIAYVIPIALDATLTSLFQEMQPVTTDKAQLQLQTLEVRHLVDTRILKLSKMMAIILLILYGMCLYYQFHHRTFMITPEAKHEGAHTVEKRYTHFWFAGMAYLAAMAAQIYSANLLVHAVESLGRQHHLNDSFVGFVLLPIVLIADLQEEVIAVRESRANRLDKAVALMVGSCMQIALLVTPILVLLGWIMDVPMTFRFTTLEVVILAASVLLINYLISDHETNWLEGGLLLAVFLMCAIAFYYDNSHLEVTAGEGTTISGDGVGSGPAAH